MMGWSTKRSGCAWECFEVEKFVWVMIERNSDIFIFNVSHETANLLSV